MSEVFSFGLWLRLRRRSLDLTQTELAERVSCSESTIRKIEADVLRPSREMSQRLAQCLALPSEEHAAFLRVARAEAAVDGLPVPSQLPAAALSSSSRSPRSNLPLSTTSFIGRTQERADLAGFVAAQRLVTITGVGGSGKTRLALEVANDLLATFSDGVWLVELALLHDPDLVTQTIARSLGIAEVAGEPLATTLCHALHGKRVLIVLDNCEHLIDACAELAHELLRQCSGIHLLTTSREALNLLGEQLYPIPPLVTPLTGPAQSLDDLMNVESVRLFCERTRAVQPRFALTAANAKIIAEICRKMDGLPLAIELAAVHMRRLPLNSLRERLDQPLTLLVAGPRDLPPRQQTLRTTIDWSYQLLSAQEQRLFNRLGIFVGGWTIPAAQALFDQADKAVSVDLVLAALLDKNLIHLIEDVEGTPRFVMLVTLQAYAIEQLELSGEIEAIRERHAAYYLNLIEHAEALLVGVHETPWLSRLATEHENLRAVLSWAFAGEDSARITIALRLCGVLWRFWWVRGYVHEGKCWLDLALSRLAHAQPPLVAKIMYGSGFLARTGGDLAAAERYFTQSLQLWKEQQDQAGIAHALNSLGVLAFNQYSYDQARALFEESLVLYQALADHKRVAMVLNNLGNIAYKQGDLERTTQRYEAALRLLEQTGAQPSAVALIKANLGDTARLRGQYSQAVCLLYEGVMIYLEHNDVENTLFCLNNIVDIAVDLQQDELGAQLLGAADALYAQSGVAKLPEIVPCYERQSATLRDRLGAAAFIAAWSEGHAAQLEPLIARAMQMMLQEADKGEYHERWI
ncbi:MAG: tetratricopeptide repeat protein [Chloroflexi bacterium]|nr:tetratricopeptide repeat protein [Chloroflexota bacterium]